MANDFYSEPILLRGDMIASLFGQPSNIGNPGDPDFAMQVEVDSALGDSDTLYRLVWYQNVNGTDTTFENGQFWRLEVYDPASDPDGTPSIGDDGWTAVPGYTDLTPKNDIVGSGDEALGDGDEYIVLSGSGGFLIYDLNGGLPTSPTTLIYTDAEQNGDAAAGDNDNRLDFADMYAAVACFVEGTRIATPHGPVPIEALVQGMSVTTLDHGPQPIRWIGSKRVVLTLHNRDLAPIRIRAGALGPGRPATDLMVSPQHRIMLSGPALDLHFAASEVLLPAKHLCHLPGIAPCTDLPEVKYWHLLFDRHEIVLGNEQPSESFHPGDIGLTGIGDAAREELFKIFPKLRRLGPRGYGATARPVLRGREARGLITV